jgi:ubiquinone/menaquinone biosynthesis C-methylase UbiE
MFSPAHPAAGRRAAPNDRLPGARLEKEGMNDRLEFTGERFIPGTAGEIWHEHWHRYHFAAPLVAGLEVLDIACGEGYGSALLATRAATVVGADIAPTAVDHARGRYATVANLGFRQADCAAMPFADASFDAVVSFETIEHIVAQEPFVDEIRRVLRPDGLLILSCPNKAEYSDTLGVTNEFHVRELYRAELAGLLGARFAHSVWYGQRPSFYSVLWPEEGAARGEIFEVAEAAPDTPSPGHARPLYFIVIASASATRLAQIAPRLSVLADRDEWVHRDYEKVMRDLEATHRRSNELDARLSLSQRLHADAIRERDALLATERARLAAQIETQQREIARRASLRWWLTLPLRRLWLALTGKPPWS